MVAEDVATEDVVADEAEVVTEEVEVVVLDHREHQQQEREKFKPLQERNKHLMILIKNFY